MEDVEQSILTSTKKILGLAPGYTAFDPDIVMHINSAFSTLNQMGVGPPAGFMIEDATPVWGAFLGTNLKLNSVKTYVFLKVRLIFDPPQSSYAVAALEKQIAELEWRLNVTKEATDWVDPDPPTMLLPDDVLLVNNGDGTFSAVLP